MVGSLEVFRKVQPKEYFSQHVDKGLRLDEREGGLESIRPILVSKGSITTADGSAIVKKGNTVALCGMTLKIAQPLEDSPNVGFIVPNVDLPAMCHPNRYKQSGPPPEEAQALSKFIIEVIDNSGMIDRESLCIKPGEICWVLNIDLSVLNHDGNIRDALITALVVACKSLRIPKINIIEDDESEKTRFRVVKEKSSPLELRDIPVSVTMAILEGERLLVDPTEEEETFAPDSVTSVLNSEDMLCYFSKCEGNPISDDLLAKINSLARKQAATVRKLIDKS